MSYQRVEKLSESSVQILCGKCIKEARIHWAQQAGIGNNHMMHVECHGEHRMVVVDEYQTRVVQSENAVAGRLQLTWDSLRDLEPEYIEQMRESAIVIISEAEDRLAGLDRYIKQKAAEPVTKRASRFEALATELED